MSLPRYPAYKPSGLKWLGEVPEHWEVLPLKRLSRLLTEKTEHRDNPVALENIEGWTGRFFETDSEFQGDGVAFESGDILFGKLRPYLAKVYLATNRGQAIGDFHVIHPLEILNPRFLQFTLLTRELIDLVNGSTFGAKMPRASWDFLGSLQLSTPPLDEQLAITSFLDRETAKIDDLIAQQQRLIELLQEKRQAVISHAVTKGLDPDAPMKDSGVDWLGEVPEHWGLVRLKHAAKDKVAGPYGASLTKSMYTRAGYRVYGQQQVIPDDFEKGDYYIDNDKYEEMKRYSVSPGDILISVMGTVGKVAVVPDGVEPGIINPRLVRYHLRDLLIPRFAQRLLLSTPFQEKILLEAKGATMDGLNMQILGDLVLPVPPRAEQEAILDRLLGSMASFDAISSSTEHSVLLLRERRSALISAAVTGQIDVRGLAPEADAA